MGYKLIWLERDTGSVEVSGSSPLYSTQKEGANRQSMQFAPFSFVPIGYFSSSPYLDNLPKEKPKANDPYQHNDEI